VSTFCQPPVEVARVGKFSVIEDALHQNLLNQLQIHFQDFGVSLFSKVSDNFFTNSSKENPFSA